MDGKIVGLGEVLYDLLPGGARLGGAPANFAWHSAQFGLDALVVSAVGNDEPGRRALATFDKEGLRYIAPRVDFPTGTVDVGVDSEGVPTYAFAPDVAWDNIPLTPAMAAAAGQCRAVCFGSLAQRAPASRRTIREFLRAVPAGCVRIFDINLRQHFYTREILADSLLLADVLKINDDELSVLSRMCGTGSGGAQAACREIARRFGVATVILTLGTEGSWILTDGGASFEPTPRVEVADTVGAGDSFTAAFTAARLAGLPVRDAHRLAVSVSAYVCTQKGATPKLPASLTAGVRERLA